MRLVVGDGLGDLFERCEAVGALGHEVSDLAHASRFDLRSGVDQHERERIHGTLADRGQRGSTAHRGADQHRSFAEVLHDRRQVGY